MALPLWNALGGVSGVNGTKLAEGFVEVMRQQILPIEMMEKKCVDTAQLACLEHAQKRV